MVDWEVKILVFVVGGVVGGVGTYLAERLRARGQLIRDAMDYSWRVVKHEKDPGESKSEEFIDVFRKLKRHVLDC